jgi:Helix-turn-helix domain
MEYMDQCRKLQTFRNIKEFDENRRIMFYNIKDKLSKGALAVWNVLAQHSCKVPGVCWLKMETIATLAQVSRSTVERAIRLFKKLGLIKVEETTRPRGGDGANVFVFQKLGEGAKMKGRSEDENPCESKSEPLKKKKETKILLNSKDINHLNNKRLPYLKFVPKNLQYFQALFGHLTKNIYGRVWLAVKNLNLSVDQSDVQHVGRIVFEQLKTYIKSGKSLSDDQLCRLAFVIAREQLKQRIEAGEIFDWSDFNRVVENGKQRIAIELETISTHKELDSLGVY